MNLKRLRVAVVATGALGLGALAAGAAGTSAPLPPVGPSGFVPGPLGSAAVVPLADDAGAAPLADEAGSALAGPRRRLDRRDAGAAEVDARYLATPLAERFTQTTPGAVNPGSRRAGADTPMTGMLAAVLQEGDSSFAPAGSPPPPVDPPPPPGDGGDDEGDDDDDDDDDNGGGGNGGGGTCDPLDDDCTVGGGEGGGGEGGGGGGPTGVPEIDGDLFGAGLLLLIGGALVLSSRRRLEVVAS